MLNFFYYHFTSLFSFKLRSKLKKKFFSYVANNKLDKKLKKYLDYKNGYFVELGANDGINQSNTFYFEKKKNWSGVLIEPYKNNYIECKKNRSKKNKFFHAACVSNNYKRKRIKLVYANLLTTYTKNKFHFNKIIKYKIHAGEKSNLFFFYTKACTLTSLLDKANSPSVIDLLSLDVEGSEFEVLKGINFKKYIFKYMLIEVNKLKEIKNFLKKKGYYIHKHFEGIDYLFKYKKNIERK